MSRRSKHKHSGSRGRPAGPVPPAGQRGTALAPPAPSRNRWLTLPLCLLLALAVGAVFSQTLWYGFVNYDDDYYVYANPNITQGFNLHQVGWAFTHLDGPAEWLPVTALSRMLDWQLYGPQAGGHHLTNLLFHAANAILLFLLLRTMTGALWRSAFVAAVFAIHPLRVESVAWITERKDVLSGLFFMLTLLCYAKAVTSDEWRVTGHRGPGDKAEVFTSPVTRHPSLFYWLAVVFFALGLMAKAMLVTVPFVLLLLDYWPLRRIAECGVRSAESPSPHPLYEPGNIEHRTSNIEHPMKAEDRKRPPHQPSLRSYGPTGPSPLPQGGEGARGTSAFQRLLVEKIPFFVLSAASCAATYVVQHQSGAVSDLARQSWSDRIATCFISYARYLGKTFWPVNLANVYPFPSHWPAEWVVGAVVLFAGLGAAAVGLRRRFPYVAAGWFWFVGMLIPVIGLVQVGSASLADRYTYLPQIGLLIVVAWGGADLCGAWRWRGAVLGTAAGAALAGLMAVAYVQTGYWKDSVRLWTHTLACTPANNLWAHYNLGAVLAKQGRLAEAANQYNQALRYDPDNAAALRNLGGVLARQGKLAEAVQDCERSLQAEPDDSQGHNNLGFALAAQGKTSEAIQHYERALELDPNCTEARINLGVALARQGEFVQAMQQYQRALQRDPDSAEAHYDAGVALAALGQTAAAIREYDRAIQLEPDNAGACMNLGIALAAQGQMAEAIGDLGRALELQPNLAEAHYNLGLALTTRGLWPQAIQHFEQAVQLRPDYAVAHLNLGVSLVHEGKRTDALPHFQQALGPGHGARQCQARRGCARQAAIVSAPVASTADSVIHLRFTIDDSRAGSAVCALPERELSQLAARPNAATPADPRAFGAQQIWNEGGSRFARWFGWLRAAD